ncbi:DUF2147 domain-containing protein [Gramella jeungdoensis]|uniref:DUF2147 domain-containing protein n=1 Tax=Gramella jeungdoensis TaxID=708091 RepID=A0ABT0Z1M3_9FLAO|nr:DUF2147 domain-containing protein [Gramella jeungdoensis]MCM8569454.1 DUF2147 domain-containing protein [Gramella jeungdoensis]
MKPFITQFLTTGFLIFVSLPVLAQNEEKTILGLWYNSDKSAKVEIYKCKDVKNEYCGKIVWLEEPTDEAGKPRLDRKNPDVELRSRPVMGIHLMSGFEYTGGSEWEDGEIYDPEKGKTYACNMKLQENGELEIIGYIGFSLMGRKMVWTRAE